jgi:hypothetical protein
MIFTLDCDSCEFEQSVEDEADGYAAAREREHPSHFVFITKTE